MLNRGSRLAMRVAGLTLVALAVGSCIGDNVPSAPETEAPAAEGGSFAMSCEANVATKRLACGPQGSSSPQLTEGSAAVIFGGQNLFVTLASSNVTTVGDTFSADVTIKNLIPQALGQLTTSSATLVQIFFELLPTNGVTVANADGTGSFTAAGQPFHNYSPVVHLNVETPSIWLDQGETSGPKKWKFDVSGITAATFQFTVLVSADVLYPDGWVDIDQDPGAVEVSGGTTLTATVKDVVGRTVTGRTLTWTSLDPGVFTIGSSSGVVSAGASNVTGTVQAASDGPEATTTAEVKVYQTLSDRTPVTTPFTAGGERNYKFTVPGGGPSIVPGIDPIASRINSIGRGARRPGSFETTARGEVFLLASAPIVTSVLGISVDSTATTTSSAPSFGADLYVRFGAPPDLVNGLFDCPSTLFFGSRESCTFDDPASGDWFVTIDSPGDDFTDAEVNADFAATTPGYDIELVFLDSGLSADQQLAVANAAAKWESVVTGDLRPSAVLLGSCGGERINLATDDVYVSVAVEAKDGAGGTLATAGACVLRGTGGENPRLSIVGSISIDSGDLAGILADTADLRAVVTHELGHVVGIGTLWGASQFGLLNNAGTDSVTFTGALAIAAYESVGGPASTEVPVEGSTGSPGTDDAHWRESTFDTELMTGFFDSSSDALSLVTAQSLADEGYTVDTMAVDAYTLPGAPFVLEGGQANPGIPYGNDIIQGPIYMLEPNGELVRIR